MKTRKIFLALIFAVLAAPVHAQGCADGFYNCGGSLCCYGS